MTHFSRSRRLATVLAASSVLLAGCDASPQPTAPEKAAVEKGAAERNVPPAVDSAPPVDWKVQAYRAARCMTRAEWVADGILPGEVWDAETVQASFADVTGDGVDEALIQVTCPAPTSTRAERVAVFAVTGSAPELLGVLGDELFHQQTDVTTDGTTVTLSGPTVAGDDPYCCPGHWGTVTYSWNGTRFVVESQHEVPGASPIEAGSLADGEHVGLLRSVAADEVAVDVIEWFEGDAALAACREDGVELHSSAWCHQYYVRDLDDRVLTLRVAASASLSYLDLYTLETVPISDVAQLAGTHWVSSGFPGYTRFRTEDGVVTALESIFVS